jgi:hypothetical protein
MSPGKEDGEIWSFDEPLYEKKGQKQWEECRERRVTVLAIMTNSIHT